MKKLENDWDPFLAAETQKPYYLELRAFLKQAYRTSVVYPPMQDIYNALRFTAFSETKVVILGQDPYINKGEAHGLSFSVQPGCKTPPSLQNIYKELKADLGLAIPNNGCLTKWAKQGVLLLNTSLTVEAGKSASHAKKGWETFTNAVIEKLNEKEAPVVYLLWGKNAKSKIPSITNPKHLVLTAIHPSPLAGGGFFGCRHFSKANAFLKQNGLTPIDWQIDDI